MYGLLLIFKWKGITYTVDSDDVDDVSRTRNLIELPDGTMLEVTGRNPLSVQETRTQYRAPARAEVRRERRGCS